MRGPLAAAALLLATALLTAGPSRPRHSPPIADTMAVAAGGFVAALRPELRERASLPFDDPNRLDWHYIPRDRRGVTLGQMTDAERIAAHTLLRAALSSGAYLKAVQITELESVLHELESTPTYDAAHRDPMNYAFTIFGDPSGDAPWGWRFEGHHVSLNFASASGRCAPTPMFLGSNPAEVRRGPRAGLSLLAEEQRLGRRLLDSLTPDQHQDALLATEAPGDILLHPGAGLEDLGEPAGLRYADMRPEQRDLVEQLVTLWTGNLAPDLADAQLRRIREAGLDAVRFCWLGETAPGRPHYYRLHGPTFIVEFDNTQNDANHIHTVWRDPAGDFGEDILRRHLSESH